MKLLILTTSKATLSWGKLPSYLAQIKNALNSGKHADWTVEVEYIAAIPKVVNERIDHRWLLNLFAPFYTKGYDAVGLHLSRKEWVAYGIQGSLRGANPQTNDQLGDFYLWSDEDTVRVGYPQFVQTLLHEMAHEYYNDVKLPDQTHDYHNANPNIIPLFKTFNWALFQGKRQTLKKTVSLLERVLELTKQLVALKKKPSVDVLLHPVKGFGISQAYGVPNTRYTQTKHHIGTDYLTPRNTPVYAPYDGEITTAGYSPALGNFCIYTYTYKGVTYAARFLHLLRVPDRGVYAKGEVIARTGNTGMSDGYHLHIDVFYNDVRIDLLTSKNFRTFTVDPEVHYA